MGENIEALHIECAGAMFVQFRVMQAIPRRQLVRIPIATVPLVSLPGGERLCDFVLPMLTTMQVGCEVVWM
eukprot:2171182-Lingulodinium_polyedra.AAC.1